MDDGWMDGYSEMNLSLGPMDGWMDGMAYRNNTMISAQRNRGHSDCLHYND